MRLYSNQNSKPFIFINQAIMEKNNRKKMYATHIRDYCDSNDYEYPHHIDITHENMHENTWAGYVDINEKTCNNY